MFIWIFVHLRNPINVSQIELLTICLYSEGSEDRFVVVQHFGYRKICQIVCRVSGKWMESKFLYQDVDGVPLANKGIEEDRSFLNINIWHWIPRGTFSLFLTTNNSYNNINFRVLLYIFWLYPIILIQKRLVYWFIIGCLTSHSRIFQKDGKCWWHDEDD